MIRKSVLNFCPGAKSEEGRSGVAASRSAGDVRLRAVAVRAGGLARWEKATKGVVWRSQAYDNWCWHATCRPTYQVLFIYLFIYRLEHRSFRYIKALAAQRGCKTLTIKKTWNNQLNVKYLQKSTELSEFLKLHNVLKFTTSLIG